MLGSPPVIPLSDHCLLLPQNERKLLPRLTSLLNRISPRRPPTTHAIGAAPRLGLHVALLRRARSLRGRRPRLPTRTEERGLDARRNSDDARRQLCGLDDPQAAPWSPQQSNRLRSAAASLQGIAARQQTAPQTSRRGERWVGLAGRKRLTALDRFLRLRWNERLRVLVSHSAPPAAAWTAPSI